jgi:hypothetical protein
MSLSQTLDSNDLLAVPNDPGNMREESMASNNSEFNYFSKAENKMYKTEEGTQLVILNSSLTSNDDHKMNI